MFFGGVVTVNADVAATNFAVVNGTLIVDGSFTTTNLALAAGYLTGPGAVTITGTFDWTGGELRDANGSLTIAAGGTLNLRSNRDKVLSGRTLNLAGATNWSDSGNLTVNGGATINNLAGGIFTIRNDKVMDGNGTFQNAGTLIKAAGRGTTTIASGYYSGIAFANNGGTIDVRQGTLKIDNFTQNAGSTTISAGASLASSDTLQLHGGSFAVSGTIRGNVVNAGLLSPGGAGTGTLTIVGDYTQTPTGVLSLDLGGTGAGQYDRFVITGRATLGGSLQLNRVNGFLPSAGDSFQVLTFGSRSGDFAAQSGLDLGNGRRLDPRFGARDLTLVTVGTGGAARSFVPVETRPLAPATSSAPSGVTMPEDATSAGQLAAVFFGASAAQPDLAPDLSPQDLRNQTDSRSALADAFRQGLDEDALFGAVSGLEDDFAWA